MGFYRKVSSCESLPLLLFTNFFQIITVYEDQVIDELFGTVVFWEHRVLEYVNIPGGTFVKPTGLLPETVDLALALLYFREPLVVWNSVMTTHQLTLFEFGDWSPQVRKQYVFYLLDNVERVLDSHSTKEFFTASSNMPG